MLFFEERKSLFPFWFFVCVSCILWLDEKHLTVNRAALQQQSKQTCGWWRLEVLVPTGCLFGLSSVFTPVHISTGRFTSGLPVFFFFWGGNRLLFNTVEWLFFSPQLTFFSLFLSCLKLKFCTSAKADDSTWRVTGRCSSQESDVYWPPAAVLTAASRKLQGEKKQQPKSHLSLSWFFPLSCFYYYYFFNQACE